MPNWKKVITSGSDATLNTLTVTNGITGSLEGTASYALTASYTPAISGTDNYIPKFNGTSTLENSLIYDNGTNVGIGTTSPTEKLHVLGNGLIEGDLNVGTVKTQSTNRTLTVTGYDDFGIRLNAHNSWTDWNIKTGYGANLVFTNNGVQNTNQTIEIGNSSVGTAQILFKTTNASIFSIGTNGGNIATKLGVLNPNNNYTGDFYIDTAYAPQTYKRFTFKNTGELNTEAFVATSTTIDSTFAGNVGIGTTSPSEKLDVNGNIRIGQTNQFHINNSNVGFYRDSNNLMLCGYDNIILKSSATGMSSQTERMRITSSGNVGIGTTSPGAKLDVQGDVSITNASISNQENTDVDTGTETVATVAIATYTAAFFDFVVKNGTNVRSGTVFACHDGTNVEFTETSTADLGDTSQLTLSVDISGADMRLLATATTDNWSVKTLVRAL